MAHAAEMRFDPALMEEAVFLVLRAQERNGDARLAAPFHRDWTSVYEQRAGGEARNAAFHRVAARYFQALGLHDLFAQRVAEWPLVAQRVEAVVIRRAFSRREEQVELYVQPSASGETKTIAIAVQPAWCLDREGLAGWLRHELLRVSDMLDPAFAYDPQPALGGDNAAADEVIRERFRWLWDEYIKGRLDPRGWRRPSTTLRTPSRARVEGRRLTPGAAYTQGALLALARETHTAWTTSLIGAPS